MKPEYTVHLSSWQYEVLVNKATDPPGEGGYTNLFEEGIYHCRACGAALYRSSAKFHSGCGWPSFDEEIPGAVLRKPDFSHGMIRTEIICAQCGGHLGHVFEGEGFTPKNVRHCVNTSSLVFHPADKQSVILGVPDFHWCQELAQAITGVLSVECGFAGSSDNTAYTEALRIEYHPRQTTLEILLDQLLKEALQHGLQGKKWYLFIADEEPFSGKVPSEFTVLALSRYERAPEEHQWFLRKAGIVQRKDSQ